MAFVARSRKSGVFLRGGVARRQTFWIGGTAGSDDINTSGTALITQLNAAGLALLPFTVVRTRGQLFLTSDQFANSEDQEIGFASAVVTEAAAGIGITAVPTPLTDASDDLFYVYEVMQMRMLVSSSIGIMTGLSVGIERIIDSKAMRKVEDGQTLITVGEASATSEGTRLYSYTRTLVKLH